MPAEVDMVPAVATTTTTTTATGSEAQQQQQQQQQPDSATITTTAATPATTTTPAPTNAPPVTATPLNDSTIATSNLEMPSKKKQLVIKGKFPSTMTPTGRQDVIALKQRLADALGDNGPLYWDALKDFVAGKLNRQEFDFYANLYLSHENAYLHNAFILSTVHNAQTATPPPSKHRSVGWAKRKRGKDGSLLDGDNERDPLKKKLKMDVMSLSKADRDKLKALVKAGDKDKLRPFVDKLLKPRISRVPQLPLPAEQLPQTFNADYARGLLAPLCTDLKELPGPETLHARMTSIALEQGLVKGVTEEVVNAMLFATESYIKSAIANAVTKRRINRSIGLTMEKDTPETRYAAMEQILSSQPLLMPETQNIPSPSAAQSPSLDSNDSSSSSSSSNSDNSSSSASVANDISSFSSSSSLATPVDSISLHDLAFSFSISPYVLVENALNAERLTALLTDSEDEITDDDLGDTGSEGDFEL
ncbi:transcriptional regulator of RNA polII, SAGA, subunit-domain-containing protein [Zychaea mexicana]|uniref:transcriptional regulator of RNA polII, SAGA, subunit-domain-containing protein n=1 Tax=Zychaea mexicana TaxID=64656 RepID=UPI0022FE6519|nr:transcriptional regulator of RNA polII, SAGA, subunit-domain-containing protein [Zychaea mexicana]KAI9497850.1 transcriptional regulator of RNA polII, SAGA, subunit-domain-containing protein [Zychaea mexicana]